MATTKELASAFIEHMKKEEEFQREIRLNIQSKVDWKYFVLILAIGGILFSQIVDIKKSIQDAAVRMERIETKLSFYDIQKTK